MDHGKPLALPTKLSRLVQQPSVRVYSLSWNKDSGNYYYEIVVTNDMTQWWDATSADSPAPRLKPSTLTSSKDLDYDLRQFSFATTDKPKFVRVKLNSIP
ncbi:MAG: hypothetical protein AAF212_09025 [Verrucomicrobiota bacterium]